VRYSRARVDRLTADGRPRQPRSPLLAEARAR
jgi:hypothetical protein